MFDETVRQRQSIELSVAPDCNGGAQVFKVTHPFHPLFGREFSLVTFRSGLGAHRVYFYNDKERLVHLPAEWTDVFPPDPFLEFSQGLAFFDIEGLVRLARYLDQIREECAS